MYDHPLPTNHHVMEIARLTSVTGYRKLQNAVNSERRRREMVWERNKTCFKEKMLDRVVLGIQKKGG